MGSAGFGAPSPECDPAEQRFSAGFRCAHFRSVRKRGTENIHRGLGLLIGGFMSFHQFYLGGVSRSITTKIHRRNAVLCLAGSNLLLLCHPRLHRLLERLRVGLTEDVLAQARGEVVAVLPVERVDLLKDLLGELEDYYMSVISSHNCIVSKWTLPSKFFSILEGVTDLGSTTVPLWTAQLTRTWAGSLPRDFAISMIVESSTALLTVSLRVTHTHSSDCATHRGRL